MNGRSGSGAQQVLVGLQRQIYQETKQGERPAPHLMSWLLDRRNLQAAWDRVRSADGAQTPGEDGLSCRSIEPTLADWLGKLADDLYHDRYQPATPRWVKVPKSRPGQFRRLGILTVKDRVVHAAVKQVLEPLLEPVFLPYSFGFRPGRSVAGALAEAVRLMNVSASGAAPLQAAASIDVATCFDTIDHSLLRANLASHLADPELDRLLDKLITAGGGVVRRFWRTRRRGLVQGSALSPMLCNLYLHEVDREMNNLRQSQNDRLHVLRYADNLLVLAHNHRIARGAVQTIQQRLGRLRQRLGERRPQITPVEVGVSWLGVKIRPRPFPVEDNTSFGYTIPDEKVNKMLDRLAEMTAAPSEKIDSDVFNMERWIVAINRQLRDWRQAYLFADNSAEVFRTLDDYARWRFGRLLANVTGERFARVRKQYRVRLPRGFWTWRIAGVRMSVLSSLAPHCPNHLTRQPAWMTRSASAAAEWRFGQHGSREAEAWDNKDSDWPDGFEKSKAPPALSGELFAQENEIESPAPDDPNDMLDRHVELLNDAVENDAEETSSQPEMITEETR